VCAWAIAKPGAELTEDELRLSLQGQIAHFKIPKHIRVVEEIPMTITGKPQKFVMRDNMLALLQSDAAPDKL
jgi:fatty-acyl-CoA synthase